MTPERKARLRNIMRMAWDFYRTARRALEDRAFGDCLRGAWSMSRRLAEAAGKLRNRKHLRQSNSLIRSPIARASGTDRLRDHHAAYVTARFGG